MHNQPWEQRANLVLRQGKWGRLYPSRLAERHCFWPKESVWRPAKLFRLTMPWPHPVVYFIMGLDLLGTLLDRQGTTWAIKRQGYYICSYCPIPQRNFNLPLLRHKLAGFIDFWKRDWAGNERKTWWQTNHSVSVDLPAQASSTEQSRIACNATLSRYGEAKPNLLWNDALNAYDLD